MTSSSTSPTQSKAGSAPNSILSSATSSASLPIVTSSSSASLPIITSPASASCCHNEVVIHLSTALIIPDYREFYYVPITEFQPSYMPLPDGSLIAQPLLDDITSAKVNLLVIGILAMLFGRNIAASGDYLRRASSNHLNPFLFYSTFISQLLACAFVVPAVLSQFRESASCTILSIISFAATSLSTSILVLVILGYKAYRCLDCSRVVMGTLVLFFGASAATSGLEMHNTNTSYRLSGGCIRKSESIFTKLYVSLELAESLFICSCFCLALWRSRGSPLARERISVLLSLEKTDSQHPDEKYHGRFSGLDRQSNGRRSVLSSHSSDSDLLRPAPSLPDIPSESIVLNDRSHSLQSMHGKLSPVPSTLSRYFPRMELFRKVMKDELHYTIFITASCAVIAVLTFVGLNVRNGLSVDDWLAINWSVISLLVIHSFGRVIHRHECDMTSRLPEAWHPRLYTRPQPPSTLYGSYRSTNNGIHAGNTRHRPRKQQTAEYLSEEFSETRALTASVSIRHSSQSWSSHRSVDSFTSGLGSIMMYSPSTLLALPSLPNDEFPASARTSANHSAKVDVKG